mgnify:CR=1 FL=1
MNAVKLPRGVPRAVRFVQVKQEGFYHWARPGQESGCPKLVVGDVSTDTYAEIVNCPRCKELPTRLKALEGRMKIRGFRK